MHQMSHKGNSKLKAQYWGDKNVNYTLVLPANSILLRFYFYISDINECSVPAYESNLCVNAQCGNTNGSFICICHLGFISDGKNNCIGESRSM